MHRRRPGHRPGARGGVASILSSLDQDRFGIFEAFDSQPQPPSARARVTSRVTGSSGFDPTSCLVEELTGEAARPLPVLSIPREGESAPTVHLDGSRLHIKKGEAEWTVKVIDNPAAPSAPLLVVETPARQPR